MRVARFLKVSPALANTEVGVLSPTFIAEDYRSQLKAQPFRNDHANV